MVILHGLNAFISLLEANHMIPDNFSIYFILSNPTFMSFTVSYIISVSEQSISAMAFNKTGEWLALGCSGLGQLLVWEWQSESYVLKQQGHFNNMSCMKYSPDGQYIVTGGDDGKVRMDDVWTSRCVFLCSCVCVCVCYWF